MQKVVTIKDVAEHANVAVSTVSRVLNNMDRVSVQTRRNVKAAIDELGYVRNSMAASIKTGLTRLVVVIVPDIINEFYTAVIQGVEAVASARGYYTLVYTTGESRTKEIELLNGEFSRIVDGVILLPATANSLAYRNMDKPTVIVDRDVPGSDMYAIVIDNYKGARMLVQELVNNGHRKIGMITGPSVFNIGIERMNGYLDALRENGIRLIDDYIKSGTWYQEDGYRLASELLTLRDPPTAIFAANNLLCMGCVEYILDKGLVIGKDISIVGFDDSVIAKYIGPGITGIRRPTSQMGRLGAEVLLDILENKVPDIDQKKVVLDVELIRRNSVAKI